MGKQLANSPLIYVIMQVSIGSILSIHEYINKLQDGVRKEFPDSNELTMEVYHLAPNLVQRKTEEQWYFTDRQKTTGVIIDQSNFFIHTTNYTTFNDILDKFVGALSKFNTILDGFTYKKLGLRYVNLIENSDNNVAKKFLGFNLSSENQFEDDYISKVETFQKTKQGAIRVRASTFNDKNEYTINKCLPPDLLETANKLLIPESADKFFGSKFTVLDLDHYTSASNLRDFHDAHVMDGFKMLHDVIETVFRSAITDAAMKEWG